MKQVLMIQNGAADVPRASLQDRTPLQAMRGPHLRALAAQGQLGSLKLTREEADGTVRLLALLCGISRKQAESLPTAPLIARALGLTPENDSLLLMGQFLTAGADGSRIPINPGKTPEARQLVEDLEQALRDTISPEISLCLVDGGQLLFSWPDAPGWKQNRVVSPVMELSENGLAVPADSDPRGKLEVLMAKTLEEHPVNQVRLDLGENAVTGIWLWGEGRTSDLRDLDVFPAPACLISSDPAAQGLGFAMGMEVLPCETIADLDGRIDAAFDVGDCLATLERCSTVVVYVPPPFGPGLDGSAEEKVRRLDAVDYYFTGPLKSILEKNRPSTLTVVAGGGRRNGLPQKGKVPVVRWGDGVEADTVQAPSEADMTAGALGALRIQDLIEHTRN